ncbi:MAG TPA: toll/interleukin-1 receptor domain-containing protein [Thermoanaerobaculia bacterium]|nr:toll/interleukin-1 receptor domain-containing protein [Thermoanaerobaculia bacterium]
MNEESQRDVFVSYTSQDRRFAERLAGDLVGYGLRVWWDQWEMQVGDSLIAKIQEGIQASSWLTVVLSPASVASNWVKRELASALADEISRDRVRVLPLLLADCELPLFLRDKLYADFRVSYEAGLEVLLRKLAPPLRPEIQKPLLSDNEGKVLAAWAKLPRNQRESYRAMLLSKLSSQDSHDRLAALTALAAIRDPAFHISLISLRSDPSPAVRSRVAFQLGRLKRPDAVPFVEALMQDSNPAVRSAARTAYSLIKGGARP